VHGADDLAAVYALQADARDAEVIWERLGYSPPTKITRMKAMQTADSLLAAATAPTGHAQPAALPSRPFRPDGSPRALPARHRC
jgi:hypothetical protein